MLHDKKEMWVERLVDLCAERLFDLLHCNCRGPLRTATAKARGKKVASQERKSGSRQNVAMQEIMVA